MRQGTLGVLLLVCALSVAAAVFAVSRDAADPRFEKIGEPVFPGLFDRVNDINEFGVESKKGRLTIYREGKIWRLKESDNHLASPNEVFKAIVGVAELKYFEPKTERADRYSRLKLEDPGNAGEGTRLTLKAGGETVADVIVGREKLFLAGRTVGGVYFRRPDDPASWLGEGNPDAGGEPKDWLAREIVNVDTSRVKQVTVRHPDGETIFVSKESQKAKKFVLDGISDGRRLKYESDVDQIASILDRLEMEDARKASSIAVDFDGALIVQAETFDGLVSILEVVERGDVRWLRIRFEGRTDTTRQEATEHAARTADWLYIMPRYEVVPVQRRMRDLLVPNSG